MKYLVVIPARYESSRFPGKPLARIGGEEMIVRVCRQVEKTGLPLAVATDDQRIYDCVERNGFRAVMTSRDHKSGTDRVREAAEKIGDNPDVVINVQGDEPFINPLQIEKLKEVFESDPTAKIATLVKKFDKNDGFEALFDPNLVKVTFSSKGKALYFSRSIIPYVRKAEWKEWLDNAEFHTHIGVYAYRREVLDEITELPMSDLEKAESLEQLRWLENGYPVNVALTEFSTIGIDTEDDLRKAEEFLTEHQ